MSRKWFYVFIIFILTLSLAGCTIIFQKGRRSDVEKIEDLSKTKSLLEERLKQEIADKQVRLGLEERGLVITFVADVLFDSGKAKIKEEVYSTLNKVVRVLTENVPSSNIGIEGHTDNEPIKFSGWKSNWELSTARALSILHYLVDEKGIRPERVSAIGYGEYRSVATNDTAEGRQLNRRVEIVILPQINKVKSKAEKASAEIRLKEPKQNLK